jgi:hypothetical protein
MKHSHVRVVGGGHHSFLPVSGERNSNDAVCVFVVGPRLVSTLSNVSFLATARVRMITARSYPEAKCRLIDARPDLLITELHLGAFNGLGLVLRAKARRPTLRAFVVSRVSDPVLRADTEKLGAMWVQMPLDDDELRGAALRTIFQGGWPGAS